ncbi:hypothetical protein L798_02381 [Zootermopsis nevadensis]|uniref:PR domain zinc finger protein 10 n=2 Tax=Zootermopsis nevadensis TaxID=136037 RepID=A0A067RNU1_ZOONE|nr:hypothetical protein L798_02381 [Zootermopsis nevadensis]
MFDDSNLWCNDCEHGIAGECNRHGALHIVSDSPVLSRAQQSLPTVLEFRQSGDKTQGLSVFSKEFIKHRTRFGPLQAPKKKGRACRSSSNIDTSTTAGRLEFRLFKGDRDRGPVVCLNTVPGNEDFCNWMVLVAPARDHQQQNLVAFQYNAAIYFVTTKDIAPGEELRVWYAKEYAAIMGTRPLAKPSDVPAVLEEPPGRQLRPRICPVCRQQRSACTCPPPLLHGRQAAKPSRSVPGVPRQQVGRTRKAGKEVSEQRHEIALPITSSTEAARLETRFSSASASASGISAISSRGTYAASSDASLEALTNPESSTSLLTHHPHSSSSVENAETIEGTNLPRINIPLVFESSSDPTLHHVIGVAFTRTGTSVSGRISHVLSENVLSSGLRSVAARKQYSSQSSSLVEPSVCISERESTTTRHVVVGSSLSTGSDISSEQPSVPVSSKVNILKSQFSDASALESTSEKEKLDERNVDVAPVSSMKSLSTLSTSTTLRTLGDDPRPKTRSSLEILPTPSSSRGAFMLLRSKLRPRTLRLSLKSKLESTLVEGSQRVGQAAKSFHGQEVRKSEEQGAKTKKDLKNEENIQRQKETSISESSQGKGTEGSCGSQSSNGDSVMEIESGPQGKPVTGVRKKESYTCPICLMIFSSLLKLSQHVESHSGLSGSSLAASGILPSNPGGSNGKKKGSHVCHICSKAFVSLGKLSQHLEVHTSSSSKFEELEMSGITGIRGGGGKRRSGHTCRVCSKVFVSPGRLSNHMYAAHPGLSSSSLSVGELTTPGVSAVASVSGVRRKGNHVCPICSKVFGSPGKLSQHMYSHTGERPFVCSECSKAFSSKFKLVRHALIHSSDSERRYRCNACDRSFHRKDHLQNHAKVHSVVRARWRCDRCGREYGSPLSHRRHLALHAAQDDGALDCGVCGRHFSTTPDILHHLKVHAGSRTVKSPADRKFRCDHCERRFFTRKDVRRHLVVHTGKRDFLCQFCPQRFGRKDHLVRHIKKSHHQGSVPASSRVARGGRRHKVTVPSVAPPKSVITPSTSTAGAQTRAVEGIQTQATVYGSTSGVEGRMEDVILLPRSPPSYIESKVEETRVLSQATLLDDPSLTRRQIVASESALKISGIETVLQSTSPGYAAERTRVPGATDVIPKSEEASLIPAVSTMDQSTGTPLGLVYGHPPPPPYPSGDLQSQTFKVFEEGNREGMIKLEPPSSSRVGDLTHLLSLIPSTSQASVLSETLSGVEHDSLLMAAQHIRTEEDIQRLLTGGTEQTQLLTSEEQSLLHLMATAASSVVGLDLPSEESAPGTSSAASATPGESDVMASLLASGSREEEMIASTTTTPLPRFTQAFQSQQQQQHHQQQPPSQQQQEQR